MIEILLVIFLQLILFLPFYFMWKKDCIKIGKSNLAVSLEERFIVWLCVCPIWIIIFLD